LTNTHRHPEQQVSTHNGCVQLFGREGVERTMGCNISDAGAPGADGEAAGAPRPTRQLFFLANRGSVVRLDQVRVSYDQRLSARFPFCTSLAAHN